MSGSSGSQPPALCVGSRADVVAELPEPDAGPPAADHVAKAYEAAPIAALHAYQSLAIYLWQNSKILTSSMWTRSWIVSLLTRYLTKVQDLVNHLQMPAAILTPVLVLPLISDSFRCCCS